MFATFVTLDNRPQFPVKPLQVDNPSDKPLNSVHKKEESVTNVRFFISVAETEVFKDAKRLLVFSNVQAQCK